MVPAMPMDAYRDGEQFVVNFDLPGVDPDAIELDVERNVLTGGAVDPVPVGSGGGDVRRRQDLSLITCFRSASPGIPAPYGNRPGLSEELHVLPSPRAAVQGHP
jgi:hypothetical protein